MGAAKKQLKKQRGFSSRSREGIPACRVCQVANHLLLDPGPSDFFSGIQVSNSPSKRYRTTSIWWAGNKFPGRESDRWQLLLLRHFYRAQQEASKRILQKADGYSTQESSLA